MSRARVLFLGDSLHFSLRDRLARILSEDGIQLVGPTDSCGGAADIAASVQLWIDEHQPDIACFSAGPWTAESLLRLLESGKPTGDFEPGTLAAYEHALMDAVRVLKGFCGQQVVFVTAPPVHEGRLAKRTGDRDLGHRLNTWIAQYNQVAASLLGQLNVVVADVHRELARHDDDGLASDGVCFSAQGIDMAAQIVANGVYGVMHS